MATGYVGAWTASAYLIECKERRTGRWRAVLLWGLLACLILFTSMAGIRQPLAGRAVQILVIGLALVGCLTTAIPRSGWPLLALLGGTLVWGAVQGATGITVYGYATTMALLYWSTLLAIAVLGSLALTEKESGEKLRWALAAFGIWMATLDVLQAVSSHGKILWLFESGYQDVYGTFASQNNYAQFMELVLPVVLWQVCVKQKQLLAGAIIAGLLYASVLACASRAGAAITGLEIGVVLVAGARRGKLPGRQVGQWLGVWCGVLLVCAAVLGVDRFIGRLQQEGLQDVRWSIVKSTADMAAVRPLTGFGLGTFAQVYPSFLRVDSGFTVPHAHNDWLEWASEGGVPWALAIVVVFGWCLRRVWHHPWGVGLVGICLHSMVDFPLQRLAVAGWAILMAAALAQAGQGRREEKLPLAARGALAILLGLGLYGTVTSTRAEAAAAFGGEEGNEKALALTPANADLWQDAALLRPDDTEATLRRAVGLNPFSSAARIQLGLFLEVQGDLAGAEAALLEAAARDRTSAPRWALAGYYFRRGQRAEYTRHARLAAATGWRDWRPVFQWSWFLLKDPEAVLRETIPDRVEVLEMYLEFLQETHRVDAQVPAALRLAAMNPPGCEGLLKSVEQQLTAGKPGGAGEIWNAIVRHGLIPHGEVSAGQIFNAKFQHELLPLGFDWRFPPELREAAVVHWLPGRLQFTFNGTQPDSAPLLAQVVLLVPGERLVLRVGSEFSGPTKGSGLHWRLREMAPSRKLLAEIGAAGGPFTVPAGCALARLVLEYERPVGEPRMEGVLSLSEVAYQGSR